MANPIPLQNAVDSSPTVSPEAAMLAAYGDGVAASSGADAAIVAANRIVQAAWDNARVSDE